MEVVCVTKLYKVYIEKTFKSGIYVCTFLLCPLARKREREREKRRKRKSNDRYLFKRKREREKKRKIT